MAVRSKWQSLPTEAINPSSLGIDKLDPEGIVDLMVNEDRKMLEAVKRERERIAVGIADRINATTSQNVIVVDLMCEPRIYNGANFSSDGFHPSDAGYALLAELLYPALRNGTAPAPSSTCPQRTQVPVF